MTLLAGCLDDDSTTPSGSTPAIDDNNSLLPDDTEAGIDAGSGNWNLRVTTTVLGTSTPSEITNVSKPSSATDFCNNEVIVNSYKSLKDTGSSWQQNSCTFDGTNGKIDATCNHDNAYFHESILLY